MKILVATGNKGKLLEFERILKPLNIEVVSPAELGVLIEGEEIGVTFEENAKLKAQELFDKTGIPTVADDSGLCIDALDGRPGVTTARYGGDDTEYPEKFNLLLDELKDVSKEDRTAAFVCSICCVIDKDNVIETLAKCEGWIGFEPKGNDGFGFDPIFYVGEHSFSEFSADEKDRISHRGKALRQFVELLENKVKP